MPVLSFRARGFEFPPSAFCIHFSQSFPLSRPTSPSLKFPPSIAAKNNAHDALPRLARTNSVGGANNPSSHFESLLPNARSVTQILREIGSPTRSAIDGDCGTIRRTRKGCDRTADKLF